MNFYICNAVFICSIDGNIVALTSAKPITKDRGKCITPKDPNHSDVGSATGRNSKDENYLIEKKQGAFKEIALEPGPNLRNQEENKR